MPFVVPVETPTHKPNLSTTKSLFRIHLFSDFVVSIRMNPKIQKINAFIGDVRFYVYRHRFSDVPLWPIFLKGYGLTAFLILGIRCLFFIGAEFADGEVINYTIVKEARQLSVIQMISFKTKKGDTVRVPARRNLYLKVGEHVKIIYKVKNAERAIVFTYAGFWVNAVVFCGIALMFWIGVPLALFGFED